MTACLLKYYQQLKIYDDKKRELEPFNLEKPLWVFVGSTVTKEKGKKEIELPSKELLADVGQIIVFIAKFLSDSQVFQRYIEQILYGNGSITGLLDDNGNDIFAHSFAYLLRTVNPQDDIERLYHDF